MKTLLLLLFLGMWLDVSGQTSRFRLGDDPRWAAVDLDDGSWQEMPPGADHPLSPRWWSRTHLSLDQTNQGKALLCHIYTLGSYEVYWDGILMGHNGQPADDPRQEISGQHLYSLVVPSELAWPGSHVLALRISTWHASVPRSYFKLESGPLEKMTLKLQSETAFYSAMFVLLVIAGVIFLVFSQGAEPAIGRFGGLCLAVALLLTLEYGKHFIRYAYPLHFYRLGLISLNTLAVGMLLPWFLMARFELKAAFYKLAAAAPVISTPFMWSDPDRHCYWIFLYSLSYSMMLCLQQAYRGRKGWFPISLVIGLTLLTNSLTGDHFADRWFFPSFLLMVALLAGHMIWESRSQRAALVQARLVSSRLKLELMRKSIQPHFLKNTLAAAMAWFEENPQNGVQLLGSLAQELDHFFKIGDRDRISIQEEIQLCHHHVRTMSFVMEVGLKLEVVLPLDEISLPPGLLITCVENALTHGQFDEDHCEIKLWITLEKGALTIVVSNPADGAGEGSLGTGTRYLETLLANHFPESWSLSQEFIACRWEVTIVIRPFHPS